MRIRLLTFLTLFSMAALPATVRPAEGTKPKSPTVLVQVKSIEGLLADAKYLAKYAGAEDQFSQVEGFVTSMITDNGLNGIDVKRPIGLYATVGQDESGTSGVALIPIADEKAVFELLGQLGIKADKGKDDVYTVSSSNFPIPVPIYVRFAHKYAYVTAMNETALAKDNLLDPAKVFKAGRNAIIAAQVHLDQIPEILKELALGQMDRVIAEDHAKEKPGETKAQRAFREKVTKEFAQNAASLVKEGGKLDIELDVDRKSNELVGQLSFAGKAGSSLKTKIADLQQSKSLFGGFADSQGVLSLVFHCTLPLEIRKSFLTMITEEFQGSLAKEKDMGKKALAQKFFKAIEPSLNSGELDFGFSLKGPDKNGHYSGVAGIKVKEGKSLNDLLKEVAQSAPEKDKEKIHLDAETADGISIHRFDVQKDFPPDAKNILGENPLWLAIREDAILVSFGEGGLEVLKPALAAGGKSLPILDFEVAVAKLIPLIAKGDQKKIEEMNKVAKAAFQGTDGNDRVRFTVEGGEAMKVRFVANAQLLAFLSKIKNINDDNAVKNEKPKKKKKTESKKSEDD